ncbi:hypothetical protein BH23GEM10_BH23GEM10_13020 [soil metagenome]
MYRRMLAAAFAVLLIPATSAAQSQPLQDDRAEPRYRITPFVGYLTGFEREEIWTFNGGAAPEAVTVRNDVARGPTVGLNVEFPLTGRFGVTAAAAFASRDHAWLSLSNGEMFVIDGNNVFLTRVGGIMHLRQEPSEFVMRRLGASVFAGGTVMHERPRNRLGSAEFVSSGTHFGINVGMSAELPFHDDRLAIQVGIEDNVMWWRDGSLASVAREYYASPVDQTSVSSDMSHAWLLRAGLSLRIR